MNHSKLSADGKQIYIKALKEIAKGSRKYWNHIDMPLRFDAKQTLKALGFKGKYLLMSIVLVIGLTSCGFDNNYPICKRNGYCSGHLKRRHDRQLEYCQLPHCNPYLQHCTLLYGK